MFRAQYRLAELKAVVVRLFAGVDVVVLPTIGTTFTIDQVLADPIATNTILGHYTHCGNLLDLCAAAVPAGLTADGRPVSLMVLGPGAQRRPRPAVAAALGDLDRLRLTRSTDHPSTSGEGDPMTTDDIRVRPGHPRSRSPCPADGWRWW